MSNSPYRYFLHRHLQTADLLASAPHPRTQLYVLLNPSKANETVDDPTITRCKGFASRDGFTEMEVVNLFAFRATDPRDLEAAMRNGVDVIGPGNDMRIEMAAKKADRIMLGWGANHYADRIKAVLLLLKPWSQKLHCLGFTKAGQPRHPLYLPGHAHVKLWSVEHTGVSL